MQPQLLKNASSQARYWRALALGLSVLAAALSASAALLPDHNPARPAPATRAQLREHGFAAPPKAAAAALPQVVAAPTATNRAAELAQLRERLDHASDGDLPEATDALLELGEPEALLLLTAATRSHRAALQSAAFTTLFNLDGSKNRDFMRAELNGPNAALALGYFSNCRDPEALPALERLARSPVQELSRPALDALLAQGVSAEGALTRLLQADTELMDALLATPPHTSTARRALRAAAISRIRAGAITGGPVFDFLEQDLSAESREALLFAAHDPASADSACTALARRADAASLTALSQLANHSDPQLAAPASCALASDPDSRSRVPLERVRQGGAENVASRALGHINAPGARAI